MRGTAAQGNCQGKTGTLHDVANLVGYCTRARRSHARVRVPGQRVSATPTTSHDVEAGMAVALAKYNGLTAAGGGR